MNRRLLTLLSGLWLSAFTFSLSAQQVGFSLPFITGVAQNQVLNLPVKVTGFDSIQSAQFVIRWNPAVLDFISVTGINALPGASMDDFGTSQADSEGLLRFAWESPLSTPPSPTDSGTTLPDGTTIFYIKVRAIGPDTSSTTVTIDEQPPTIFEVVQYVNEIFTQVFDLNEVALTPGFVAIGYTIGTDEPTGRLSDFPFSLFPNPFTESTRATFELATADRVRATVTDAAGRAVFQRDLDLPAGQHGMDIASALLPGPGLYFLTLRSTYSIHTQPLLFH